jgi:NAD(P)-dependent dehydrogenase (short-subunit alcohol dehydrogenase family)
VAEVAGKQERRLAQAFVQSPALRRGIEEHAIKAAIEYFRAEGWDVADVSATESYDLHCIRGEAQLRVEVKGTTSDGRQPVLEVDVADFRRVIEVNLIAPFVMSAAAARLFVNQGEEGRVVHIASIGSFVGGTNVGAYIASKVGIAQLAKAQSNEWAPLGITVNAVAPGYIATDLDAVLRDDPERFIEISRTASLPRLS